MREDLAKKLLLWAALARTPSAFSPRTYMYQSEAVEAKQFFNRFLLSLFWLLCRISKG